MFHSRDSPRLLVCDTGVYMEENNIGFITVAICGGYISKYPRLAVDVLLKALEDTEQKYIAKELRRILEEEWVGP